MPGLAEIALGAAPIAGGVLLGAVAGNLHGPDVRAVIKADLDLLDRIPDDQFQRRAAVSRVIGQRIDDLIAAGDRGRELRQAAMGYKGNWRDIVVFVCTVLFTIVWWHIDHHRTNWLVMFIALILVSVIAGAYALRGLAARSPTYYAASSPPPRPYGIPRRNSRPGIEMFMTNHQERNYFS